MEQKDFVFIIPETETFTQDKEMPASYLRKTFVVPQEFTSAGIAITALGVYKAYLNGTPLSEEILLPGFTNYHERLQYQSYDITDRLHPGINTIAVTLGNGWYRGCLGLTSVKAFYGDTLQLAAEIRIESGGSVQIIQTDESWKATQDGPIRVNDLKTFEIVDMTKELTGWTEADYDDSEWHECRIGGYEGRCIPHEGEPILEQERFSPVVLHTPDGNTVLDFGQNLAGHVEFTVEGCAGHIVTLKMGECLDENGNFTTGNLQAEGAQNCEGLFGQTLQYTLKEGRQTYKSQFLISGYRYVLVKNWPEEICAGNFVSIAVHSLLKETGSFTCSHPLVNQFVSNSVWSWRSNSVDIPTDCPTRERAGWAGDINVFSQTASFYTDTRKFLHKYLGDFMSLQTQEGQLPYICPEVPFQIIPGWDTQRLPFSSAGWSDALIHIPMVLYRMYGDTEDISYVYEAAKKYMDFNVSRARKKNPNHLQRTEEHFDYILDTGFHWGEWLEPGSVMAQDIRKAIYEPDAEVATAWLYQSLREVSDMARILGAKDDELKYSRLAEKVKKAYRSEFLKGGIVDSSRACRYVRPLAMGLADETDAAGIAAELNRLVRENDFRINTGFLTTYKILPVLCDYGYAETAYRLLENEACPGWLYEVKKGATTTWENWLGISESGKPTDSLNHYAPGAMAAWLYEYCAGIRPAAPGFEKVLIKPVPGGSLSWARAEFESVNGRITSEWKIKDNTFFLHVTVPSSITGTAILPDGSEYPLTNTEHRYSCPYELRGSI